MVKPVVYGIAGLELSADERAFFRDADPAGYILFGRNVADRAQMRALTDSLRDLSGRADVPILIDQEGGRVARMKSPVWPEFPPGSAFDRLYDVAPSSAIAAARANAQALGQMLAEVGVNVDCLPVLDVRRPGATEIVGDRSFGAEPLRVAALGRAVLEGLASAGVVGVIKHMPGHGRALVDSHHELPHVDASDDELAADIAPFTALNKAPMGMTAHVVYEAWDAERPATLSPVVIEQIIRQRIGFGGLLFSDDLDMKALTGDMAWRASSAVAAGCDIALNCWARMDDQLAIANALPDISDASRARLGAAMASIVADDQPDFAELVATRDALLALA